MKAGERRTVGAAQGSDLRYRTVAAATRAAD